MPRTFGLTNFAPYPTPPAVGLPGDSYYNTAEKVLYLSDGTVWNSSTTPVSAGSANYKWNTSTAAADPGTGRIGMNNAAAASATAVYASVFDQNGSVVRLDALNVGDTFVVYQTGTLGVSVKFTVAAPVTNNANAWFTIPVTYVSTGGSGFSPTNNTSVQMQSTAAPGSTTPTITPATDFNACVTTGLYSIAGNATNGLPAGGGTAGANVGILEVFAIDSTHLTQVFYGGANQAAPEVWTRSLTATTWSAWDSIMGRIPSLGNFGLTATNGLYNIAGTATGGPGVTGAGILTCYGNTLGLGGLQANAVQTWTSYVTGESWQRTNSAGAGFGAWKRLFPIVVSTNAFNAATLGADNNIFVPIRGQEIGYGSNNTNVTGITTTGVRICGTASIAFKAGRKYRITISWRGIFSTVLNDLMTLYITIGGVSGTNVRECVVQNLSTNSANGGGSLVARYAPGADVTNTADFCAVRTVGTGTCQLIGASAAGQLQEIVVEDMGP
jgi:hypothetical protein